jgi:acyl-coenzyme A synthetase/AMP-(fatty) acid ligase
MQAGSALINRQPDRLIAQSEGGPLSVRQLIAFTAHVAGHLPEKQYVFNLYPNPVDYLLGFCATTAAGQCTLMPPNRLDTTLDAIRTDYPDSYVIGPEVSGDLDIRRYSKYAEESGLGSDPVPVIPDSQLCAIAFTSGSTGAPSPNLKSWKTLRDGSISNAAMLLNGIDGAVNVISMVPPQHMWGLETSVLLPLFAESAISHHTPFYPLDLKDALESTPMPRVLVSTPVHLAAMVRSGLEFAPVERVLCATAPLSSSLAEIVEKVFSTHLLEVFGCTETGILASRLTTCEEQWTLSETFNLDTSGGEARIAAAHLPSDVRLQDAVIKTGDKRFRWLGRHEDLVNIAGKRGSLADLNRRLQSIPGVIDGVIFFPGEEHGRLAAMVVAPNLGTAEIRDALRHQVEPAFMPRPITKVERLPRSDTGKLAKQALLELFESMRQSTGVFS